jgi:hypothetical protein
VPPIRAILEIGINRILPQVLEAIKMEKMPSGFELYVQLAPVKDLIRTAVEYYVVDFFHQKVVWLGDSYPDNKVPPISKSTIPLEEVTPN